MPQKKNSDSLELLRGKSGRLFGNVNCFSWKLSFSDKFPDGRIFDDTQRPTLDLQQGPPGGQRTLIRHC